MRRLAAFALLTVLMSVGAAACSSSAHDHATATATATSARPDNSSPEAGFARDMSVHHAQAVAMAEAIRDRTTDPDLKILATNIALGQQAQIGRMSGWLDEWGLTQTSTTPPMACITLPAPRNRSALKKACVTRWNMPPAMPDASPVPSPKNM